MATKTIREHFINTFGTDLLIAYFDPGAGRNGGARYNFACYSICDDRDWIKAIGAIRPAACLFKLPMEASASVDIVTDNADPNFRTAFFVQIHRSSHFIDAPCKLPAGVDQLNDASKSAVEEVQQSLKNALETLSKELPLSTESFKLPPPPKPICSLTEPCGGSSSTTCEDPITTEAECIQLSSGVYQIVCVPRITQTET